MDQEKQVEQTHHFVEQINQRPGFGQLLGMRVEAAEPGRGRVRLTVDERLMHPQGLVHGGVIFSLADTAMAMALLASYPPGTRTGTIEAKINYLRAVRNGQLLAEAAIIHQGRTTAVLEATVYHQSEDRQEQRAVARVLSTFYIFPGEEKGANAERAG
ncbi:MAG: PaaI family thioesterase [Thermogemmatispora sp.]|uniref:PaaI family thioesterase n=1 Tax=Thermogemmatispora sp. TaxID=1968838 RepID=UPI0026065127|nr:PaaI family thioesterase [Thermogemmatispora sp.]MBX5455868.1 PaaI family thioesterase [Thermogemmatispora sp.]